MRGCHLHRHGPEPIIQRDLFKVGEGKEFEKTRSSSPMFSMQCPAIAGTCALVATASSAAVLGPSAGWSARHDWAAARKSNGTMKPIAICMSWACGGVCAESGADMIDLVGDTGKTVAKQVTSVDWF